MSIQTLTTEVLLSAYAQGFFPMASSRHGKELRWYAPDLRGVIPLESFRVPKTLAKAMRKHSFHLTMNADFRAVITACADVPRVHEKDTWINDEIIEAYCALHVLGHAQSVEVWAVSPSADGAAMSHAPCERQQTRNGGNYKLVGGLYGLSLGRAFFGESMFSRATNASKIALVHLVDWLRANDYTLLDTQYVNDHLLQFGVQEIPREEYLQRLRVALSKGL